MNQKPSSKKSAICISLVICTYNRADVFIDALQTICKQTLDMSLFEVIIVDNNSSDNTAEISKDFCRHYANVRYFLETNQGLSFARNRGWNEARGKYVGYIDDDCKVPEQFLFVAHDIINQKSPVAFGGPALAFYNSTKPAWYKDSYGSHEPFDKPLILPNDKYYKIYGMNMFFRRSILRKFGGFDPKLGMIGGKVAYCEETALLKNISEKIPEEYLYFDPALYVYHLVQKERMSARWFVTSTVSLGKFSMQCAPLELPPNIDRLLLFKLIFRQAVIIVKDFARSILRRDRTLYPFYQNYLFERTYNHLLRLGRLVGHFEELK